MKAVLLERFVQEARELLQTAATGLLALERDPADATAINEVFRAVHTLKGSSGLFDTPALTRLVHAGEDVLQQVRTGAMTLDSGMVDLLLDSLDQVGAFIDQLDRDGELAGDADRLATQHASALRARLGGAPVGTAIPADAALAPVPAEWLSGFAASEREALLARARGGEPLLAVRYTPEEGCFYSGTDPLAAIRDVPDLLAVAVAPREPWGDPATDFDPYRCNLVFTALTAASREAVEQTMTYELDAVELRTLAEPAVDVTPPPAASEPPALLGEAGRHIVRTQLRVIASGYDAVRLRSTGALIGNLLRSLRQDDLRDRWEAALAAATAGEDCAPVAAFLAALEDGPAVATATAELPAAPVVPLLPVAPIVPPSAVTPPAPAGEPRAPSKTLKVDQGKIDLLMNLIGELVVQKNALPFLARRAEEIHGSREMGREIKEQFATLDRLTQEMQGAIMQIRMLPVAEVFDRFPRLVRDIARRLDKQVELVMEGTDTAADKTIVEALGDPLLHIVRNSLDHGIEEPATRIAAGKPPLATLRLRAWQDNDCVVIEIADDGRGIDPARIRSVAVDKGVVTREQADGLSDQEAINLIYRPGFSTAAEISDLSGRGVGMDVVLSTVQKLGGRVSVSSQFGNGTVTRLSLPLSMAVTRIMVVEIGGSLYGIPIDHVVQTTRLDPAVIQRIKHREVFVLRDEVVPLIRMTALLGGRAAAVDPGRGEAVLVCRVEGRTIGLVIDDFREGMDVILKPMTGLLAEVGGYCGTTLLGDGRVLLVLDLKELF
ncbi:chemotaxis protein CheA [Sphingomonas sp. 8AM]|uniref:chemotaxis protein CheA n=1 Tax=Sphingomonas sp. 8AM TaxID=2653170 RepID=UPI0012F46F38|nr:chemotaxis protein CheA [Sphingomonas sp. 8AM]VXC31992.1 Hpt domain protein [Sphingomonas sp. 8AM]